MEHIFDRVLLKTNWEDYELEYKALVNFIVTTTTNPYSFMPKGWEGSIGSSTGFSSFLGVLHHAMIDDGELTMLSDDTCELHPKLLFVDRFDLSKEDKLYGTILDSVVDFIEAIKAHETFQAERNERMEEWFNNL
jgi:hypothetical protein